MYPGIAVTRFEWSFDPYTRDLSACVAVPGVRREEKEVEDFCCLFVRYAPASRSGQRRRSRVRRA